MPTVNPTALPIKVTLEFTTIEDACEALARLRGSGAAGSTAIMSRVNTEVPETKKSAKAAATPPTAAEPPAVVQEKKPEPPPAPKFDREKEYVPVGAALTEMVKLGHKAKALEVLSKYGVNNGQKLADDQLGMALNDLTKALAEIKASPEESLG